MRMPALGGPSVAELLAWRSIRTCNFSPIPFNVAMSTKFNARITRKSTVRPPATAFALAIRSLWLEVERDFAVYGDECKFGGGKVLRDGMGQAAGVRQADTLGLRDHQRPDRRLHRHL